MTERLDPDKQAIDARWLASLGRSFRNTGRDDDAEFWFETAIADGYQAGDLHTVAQVAIDSWALFRRQGRHDDAAGAQRLAAEVTGDSESTAIASKISEVVGGDRIEEVPQLLDRRPSLRLLGQAVAINELVRLGRLHEAERWARRYVVEAESQTFVLVDVLMRQGKADDVGEWLDELVAEEDPINATLTTFSSQAVAFLVSHGRANVAERRLRPLAEQGVPVALAGLADLLLVQQRIDEAARLLQRLAAIAGEADYLVEKLVDHDAGDDVERWLVPIARGELGADNRHHACRALAGFHYDAHRWEDAERWIRRNVDAVGPTRSGVDGLLLSSALLEQGRVNEAIELLYPLARGFDHHALELLVTALAAAGRADEAEQFLRARVERGHEHDYPLLARVLTGLGRGDDAELMLYRLAASGKSYGRRFLFDYLEEQGRHQEAENWRQSGADADTSGVDPQGPIPAGIPDIATVVATATITTAVLPFIQTLVSEAAKDTYSGAKAFIRRLRRSKDLSSASDPETAAELPASDDETDVLLVEDPAMGITVHLSSDLPLEAIRALKDVDVPGAAASLDEGHHAHLRWSPDLKAWRVTD